MSAETPARRPERACGERQLRRRSSRAKRSVGRRGLGVVAFVHRARFAREAKGEDPTCDVVLRVRVRADVYVRAVFRSRAHSVLL